LIDRIKNTTPNPSSLRRGVLSPKNQIFGISQRPSFPRRGLRGGLSSTIQKYFGNLF
jgi:hypothetical protein